MLAAAVSLDLRLSSLYPVWAAVPQALREETLDHGSQVLCVTEGQLLFEQGSPCRGLPLLLSGEVRVARGSPGGRSMELYRITPGEMCVASTSCLLGSVPVVAYGEVVDSGELLVVSTSAFEALLAVPPFRRYVFGIFADRLADLMALVEAVAFHGLDRRLAGKLLGHGSVVHGTQQTMADELGTVREIVTRLLKRFERAGWIAVGRERVEIRDAAALRALAAGDHAT